MNEIISFNKEIEFNTNIDKIVSISLEHTLNGDDNSNIKGDLILNGTYKESIISIEDKPFSYKIPIDIVIDSKYDIGNITIDIDDFTYEVESPNILKINVDLLIDNLKIKEDDEIINVNDLFLEQDDKQKLEIDENEKEEKQDLEDNSLSLKEDLLDIENEVKDDSLFSNLDSITETYKTYTVYILRENDNIEDIIAKYKISREKLSEYNDLSNITNGSKLIIPCSYE